jgi:DNA polymerase III subunit gamma/tau
VSYTVLARRYRSTSFAGVIGQEPIAGTLRNAIEQGRVAHAYLFTGTRGVGKTSMARIFARALNAPDTVEDAPMPPDADADGGFPQEDVQQRMAESIMRGEDLNVIEIDGASNNSVDQARQLIANAGLSPTGNARYKIYIIDEVHMLSPSAFNALLKTMEEPPSHVKFILCTTEPHKIPATIHSRCQAYDFRNIPTPKIADHLASVLGSESIEADQQVVWQIARLANGSMRDGLSLLDRLIATGQSPLTPEVLEEMFGLPDAQLVNTLVDALASGDVKASLESTGNLIANGVSQDQILEVLIERFRQLMLISACGVDSDLVELSDEARTEAAKQAERFDTSGLTYMIALCETVQRNGKASATPRALLDATMVRLALAEKMADVTAVLSGTAAPGSPGSAAPGGQKKKLAASPSPQHPKRQPLHPTPKTQNPPPQASPQAPPLTPQAPSVDPTDLGAVMAALRERVSDRPALSWLKFVTIDKIDEQAVVLSPTPGHREVLSFAKDPRRLQVLTDELIPILGRRVRVTMQAPAATNAPDPSTAKPTAQNGAARHADRRAAMDLPLVKKVLEVFPDAVLFDVRDEGNGKPPMDEGTG